MRLATIFGLAFVWLGLTLAINSVALAEIKRPDRGGCPGECWKVD
jgi:hypothetical protein